MKRLRIGKDFGLSWKIKAKNVGENAPYTPSSDSVLLLVTPYNKVKAEGATFDGDTVRWIFRGKDQKHLGVYGLELVENQGENGMITIDTCEAFELVAHSCEETGHDGESLIFDTLEFITDVELNALRGPQGPPGPGAATPDWAAQSYEEGYIKNKRFGIQELIPSDLIMPYSELRKVDLEGLVYGFQAYEYPLDESLYDPFVSSDDNPDAMDIFNIANSGEGRVVRISDLAWNEGHRYIELTKENFNQNVADVCGLPFVTVWIPMINEHYLAVVNDKCYIIANIVGTFNPNPSDYLQVYESYRLPETYISEDIARVEDVYEELIPIWENVDRIDKEISNLSKEIENLPSGDSSVFEAVYGVTTYDEIKAANDEGKIVVARYNSRIYRLSAVKAYEAILFASEVDNSYAVKCTVNNAWSGAAFTNTHALKTLDNGNAQITIAGKTAEVVTPQNVGKQGVIRQTQTWTQAADKGYDYVMSNLVRGAIPQANIDLFTSAGAIFNEESGYFELNGLTDISYEEMINIHNYTIPFSVGVIAPQGVMLGRRLPIRTPYALKAKRYYIFSTGNWDYLFWDSSIERVKITEQIALASLNTAFSLSNYLTDVDGVISLERASNIRGVFINCMSLRSIQFTKLKASIEIKQSPRLTNASILYMIQNEIATSAIVITLHADAYARAMADAEIQAALEAHPNVSLASA